MQRKKFCRSVGPFVSVIASMLLASAAHAGVAFSKFAQAHVGVSNSSIPGQGIIALPGGFAHSNDGAQVTATGNQDFTGMDRIGASRTMNFTGTTSASANFGQLRSSASGTVTNTYYNAANPVYDGSTEQGSPDSAASLGFAGFTDTLAFGGTFQQGYKARYIFHIDGTNSGYGTLAGLFGDIAGTPFSFNLFGAGVFSQNFATSSVEVAGNGSQQVNVTFSDQFVVDMFVVDDGSTLSGSANFSSTATLLGVQFEDANGNVVSGVQITSTSGTAYEAIVPEPASIAIALPAMMTIVLTRRRSARAA